MYCSPECAKASKPFEDACGALHGSLPALSDASGVNVTLLRLVANLELLRTRADLQHAMHAPPTCDDALRPGLGDVEVLLSHWDR